ncbi:MAG: aldehyde ferredoxin oxidoreductase family protein [Desulfurococcus sp.]
MKYLKGGYTGRILFINLTDKTIHEEPINPSIAEKYIGGKGYALYVLYKKYLKEYMNKGLSPRDIDPLGPENVLSFTTGPITGIPGVPSPGRYHVMALKSPLTGSVASANSGGEFGPFLKFAGYDMVFIEGEAEKPVYIEIVNGHVDIRDASDLWGLNTFTTTSILKKRVNHKNTSVACIGPAGENKVLFAAIINDEHRAAGRTGVGAIMGSKKLKAIVVAGDNQPRIADTEEYRKLVAEMSERIRKNPVTGGGLPQYGTAVLVNIINQIGGLPYKNWQYGYNPEADKISGETLASKYLIKRRPCWGCQIACGRVTRVQFGPYQVLYSEGPEYESIWALGNDTGVMDLEAIIKANHLCDELGLDTISMGATIATAMELYEKGLIPSEDLEGMDLRFSNPAALVDSVWRTAYRVGFGAKLALGSKRLAEMYGAPELSMSVKGLEMPAYDPRAVKGIGLNYATANRGGCHVSGYTIASEVLGLPEKTDPLSPHGKAKLVKIFQDLTSVVNSAVNCLFTTFEIGARDYARLFNTIAGFSFTEHDVMTIGERIYNLERYIMSLYGFSAKDDTLPPRLLREPMPEGPAKGQVVELDVMLKEYYELRGWVNGIPTPEKLRELGIEL